MAVTAESTSAAAERFHPPHSEHLPQCRRLLVVVYGHLSDTMAATPALRSLRAALPEARIEVLALTCAHPILDGCPYVDAVVEWNDFRRKGASAARIEKAAVIAALATRLRRRRYDATLVLHNGTGAMRRLARMVGSPVRAGLSAGADGYTHPSPPAETAESAREENSRILAAFGVKDDGGPVELWPRPEDSLAARRLVGSGDGPLVGIHAGADWSCQQWLPERFAEVASTLQRETGARIVLTGSASESWLEEEIAGGMAHPPIRAVGRTSFGALVEVIRGLDLLICVSSAASSVAAVTGTPSVVLLGPEDGRFTGMAPSPRRKVLQPGGARLAGSWCELSRWGVLSGCDSPACRGVGGLAELESGAVISAALELLGSPVTQRAHAG
jgi:ADP-heptose:LPS heptosyltransferase